MKLAILPFLTLNLFTLTQTWANAQISELRQVSDAVQEGKVSCLQFNSPLADGSSMSNEIIYESRSCYIRHADAVTLRVAFYKSLEKAYQVTNPKEKITSMRILEQLAEAGPLGPKLAEGIQNLTEELSLTQGCKATNSVAKLGYDLAANEIPNFDLKRVLHLAPYLYGAIRCQK